MTMKVSIAEAKEKLEELIKAVEGDETVTICRDGEPVTDIVRTAAPKDGKRKLGALKDQIVVIGPDWWKPVTNEEVDKFLDGDY